MLLREVEPGEIVHGKNANSLGQVSKRDKPVQQESCYAPYVIHALAKTAQRYTKHRTGLGDALSNKEVGVVSWAQKYPQTYTTSCMRVV
jgi:hypothetical protein